MNVAYWGGLVPDNAADAATLTALLNAGALGLKGFLSDSGVDGFGRIDGCAAACALHTHRPFTWLRPRLRRGEAEM